MAKSYRQKMLEKQRKYQSTYRERMRLDGWKQITIWLDPEATKAVENLKGTRLSEFISAAVKSVTSKHTSETSRNLTNKVASDVTSKATQAKSSRYMSAELEDKILALRESGLSLNEISKKIAAEGFISTTGRPYRPATLSKVIQRASRR